MTTKELSDIYFSAITPAGFTFSIWSIIYLGLLVVSLAIISKRFHFPKPALWYYVASCVANCLRIIVWHYQQLTASLVILRVLLATLLLTYHHIKDETQQYIVIVKNIFLTYIGRVLVASLLITTIFFTHTAGSWFTDNIQLYAIIALCSGLTINSLFLRGEKTQTTTLVFLWALFGIYHGQSDEITQIIVL